MLPRARPQLVFAVLGLLGPALAGCADLALASRLTPKGVDPASPVARQVRAAAARDYAFPSFRDVPARPRDVRPAGAWRAAVVDMIGERRALKGWTAENPALTGDTEGFAAAGRAVIPPEVLRPLDATVADPTEAFVERTRQRAAPPPPPR